MYHNAQQIQVKKIEEQTDQNNTPTLRQLCNGFLARLQSLNTHRGGLDDVRPGRGAESSRTRFLRDDEVESGLWCPFLGWNVLLLAKYQKGPSLISRRIQDSEPLNWERYPLKHIGNIHKTRLELEHEIWGCSSVVGCSVVSRPWVHSRCTQSLSW